MPIFNTNSVYLERNGKDMSAQWTHIESLTWSPVEQNNPLGFNTRRVERSDRGIVIEIVLKLIFNSDRIYEYNDLFNKDSVRPTSCELVTSEARIRVEGFFKVVYLGDPDELANNMTGITLAMKSVH